MGPRRWDEDETRVLLQAWQRVANDHRGREEPLSGAEAHARILQRFVELSQEHTPSIALCRSVKSVRCKCESLVKMATIIAAYNEDTARDTRRSGNTRRQSKRKRIDKESSDGGRDWFALSVSEKKEHFVRANGRANNYSEVDRSMFQMINELMKRDKLRAPTNPEMNSTSNGIDANSDEVLDDSDWTSASENDRISSATSTASTSQASWELDGELEPSGFRTELADGHGKNRYSCQESEVDILLACGEHSQCVGDKQTSHWSARTQHLVSDLLVVVNILEKKGRDLRSILGEARQARERDLKAMRRALETNREEMRQEKEERQAYLDLLQREREAWMLQLEKPRLRKRTRAGKLVRGNPSSSSVVCS
jgi:hypothetical protein